MNERTKEGVSTVTGNRRNVRIKRYDGEGSGIVWVKLKVVMQVRVIVCGFGATENRSIEVKERFWMDMELYLDNFDRSNRIILVGEMNAKVSTEKT